MFAGLTDLLANPLVWKVLAFFYIFSAIVGALPTPETNSAKWYQFLFRFMHILAGNISRAAIQLKIPGVVPEDPKP